MKVTIEGLPVARPRPYTIMKVIVEDPCPRGVDARGVDARGVDVFASTPRARGVDARGVDAVPRGVTVEGLPLARPKP